MKRLLVAVAIAMFAVGAGADDVYRGLAKGSPDLHEPHGDQAIGMQPETADIAAFEGRTSEVASPSLYPGVTGDRSPESRRDLYGGFCGGNPDLHC